MTLITGRPLWEQAYDAIRDRIVSGDLAPGHRLVEKVIASELGVSRGPIRSALAELERSGLVSSEPRRGSFVAMLGPEDVRDVYEVREALEVLAFERIIARSDGGETGVRLLEILDSARDRISSAIELDLAFHRELVRSSTNARLLIAWEIQTDLVRFAIAHVQRSGQPDVPTILADHRILAKHLVEGRPGDALSGIREHLTRSREICVRMVENAG